VTPHPQKKARPHQQKVVRMQSLRGKLQQLRQKPEKGRLPKAHLRQQRVSQLQKGLRRKAKHHPQEKVEKIPLPPHHQQ